MIGIYYSEKHNVLYFYDGKKCYGLFEFKNGHRWVKVAFTDDYDLVMFAKCEEVYVESNS